MPSLTRNKAITRFRRAAKTAWSKDERLALLRKFADVRVKTEDVRTLAEIRAAYKRGNPRGRSLHGQCWCCRGWASVYNHHVIQLQHGGSNYRLNMVRICGECHADVHPWLERPAERTEHRPELETPGLARLIAQTTIEGLATPAGGWTKETLAGLGVPWPPPRGWKKHIEARVAAR